MPLRRSETPCLIVLSGAAGERPGLASLPPELLT